MRSDPRLPAAALAMVLALVALVHTPAATGPYLFDDLVTVAVDPGARSLVDWWADAGRHVRPLTKASFALTHSLGRWLGDVPTGHHLGNLLIHLAAVAALYALGRRVFPSCMPRADPPAAGIAAVVAAALFGLHPLGSEAVDYISGRSMALGTLLAASSLWAYVRWRSGEGGRWLATAAAASAGAFLARETAFVAPLLWLGWEAIRTAAHGEPAHGASTWRGTRSTWLLVAAIVAVFATWLATHPRYGALLELSQRIAAGRPFEPTLIAALRYFAAGVALLRYPSIDPDVDPALLTPGERMVGGAAVAALAAIAWRARRSRPHLLLALVWVLAWIGPVYALRIRHDAIAERHFHPAIWGVAFALALEGLRWLRTGTPAHGDAPPHGAAPAHGPPPGRGAPQAMPEPPRSWPSRPRALLAAILCCTVMLAEAVVTATRSADYRSEIALWEAARRSAPRKVRVLNNLGVAYMSAGRWDDAVAVLSVAEALDPQDEQVVDNLLAARERDPATPGWTPPPGPAAARTPEPENTR